jgi:hypothetical protein
MYLCIHRVSDVLGIPAPDQLSNSIKTGGRRRSVIFQDSPAIPGQGEFIIVQVMVARYCLILSSVRRVSELMLLFYPATRTTFYSIVFWDERLPFPKFNTASANWLADTYGQFLYAC